MNAIANIESSPKALWFGNTLVEIKLSASEGQDGISIIEHWMPYGDSPPVHIHRNEDEIFHILKGTVRFWVDGVERIAHAGETVLAPKGVPHSYRAESQDGVQCLTITRGSDFETMVREASRPATRAGLPEASAPTPEMVEFLTATCVRNGIDIVGAPLS